MPSAGGVVGWENSQFPEFFASQYGPLRRLGFLLTGDWSQGEELAQDALVRVYRRWALVRRQTHPEAYARKVLINHHRSLLRRLRLDARHAGQARIDTADAGQREELLVVWAAIRRLPARQRAVVVLRYHEDLPELEVARLLRMPVGTVKSTANRALARLRKDLASRGRPRRQPEEAAVNLEELVRAALTEQASAEPEEAGAYDRFLRHRRRRAWQAAGSAGLAVVLALVLAVGGAWLFTGRQRSSVTGPVTTTGMIRDPQQGFALTPPPGWQVDQEATQRNHQVQQQWLVLAPIHRDPQASMQITVHTAVTDPLDYPGRPGTPKDRLQLPPTQGTSPLEGRRYSGRRADGRAFAVGTQNGLVTYMLAWPYHCPGQAPCPPAARWRVLQLEAEGEGAGWPEVQRVVRRLVETVRPITNALPGGPFQREVPGLFGEPLMTIATGGQGDYAWRVSGGRFSPPQEGYWVEIAFPKFNGMGGSFIAGDLDATVLCGPRRAGMVFGSGPPEVTTVRVELAGRPAVTVPTSGRDKNLPFTVWVLAPLPLHVQVRAVVGLDATGRQVGRSEEVLGVPGAVCRA